MMVLTCFSQVTLLSKVTPNSFMDSVVCRGCVSVIIWRRDGAGRGVEMNHQRLVDLDGNVVVTALQAISYILQLRVVRGVWCWWWRPLYAYFQWWGAFTKTSFMSIRKQRGSIPVPCGIPCSHERLEVGGGALITHSLDPLCKKICQPWCKGREAYVNGFGYDGRVGSQVEGVPKISESEYRRGFPSLNFFRYEIK